jgi:hypothetical protein
MNGAAKGPLPTRNSESHSRLRPGFQEHQDPAHRNAASYGGPTWTFCYRSGVCIAALHMHDPKEQHWEALGSTGVILVVGVSVDELRRGGSEETSCAVAPSSFAVGLLFGSISCQGSAGARATAPAQCAIWDRDTVLEARIRLVFEATEGSCVAVSLLRILL